MSAVCDNCGTAAREVRSLPTGGWANAILCRQCFAAEISYRKDRNAELGNWTKFALPTWDSLKVYVGVTA